MQYTLTATTVQRYATDILGQHLRLTDYKRACSAETLLTVVFAARTRLTSLFAAALGLRHAPAPETVRQTLHANLPDSATVERRLNDAWPATRPPRLGRQVRLAIDLTLLPCHGQPWRDDDELYKSRAKSGTCHFHASATASLILRGQRSPVALTYVRKGESMTAVVKRWLATARRADIRPQLLLLDRGFYAADAIRYRQAARCPFLMPVPIRGRRADRPHGPGGTRVFATWRRSGFDRYRLRGANGRPATVGMCVHCRNRSGRRGKRGRERRVSAYWGFVPPAPAAVSELYRTRFGSETSYRQMNQGRARTWTRNPAVRLFLVGGALVLRNLGVGLHWQVLAGRRRGGRRLRLEALPVKAMLLMLLEVAATRFGLSDDAPTERPIPKRLAA